MFRSFIAIFLCLITIIASARDKPNDREAAAERYLKADPMSQMLDETSFEISKQLPVEKRPEFLRKMKIVLRADLLENLARTSMIKHFTADELNALADFYGSKHGASVMKKFGIYMADVLPSIQAEVQRALQEINKPAN